MDYRRYTNPYGRRRRYPRERREPEYIFQKWWVVDLRDARGERIETLGGMYPFRTEQEAREALVKWTAAASPKQAKAVAQTEVREITIKLDPAHMP